MTYKYDTHQSTILAALRWRHTVLPAMLKNTTFWLFFTLHLVIHIGFQYGYLDTHDNSVIQMHWKTVQVVTAMTTFFEVFYTNHVFARYVKIYDLTRSILNHARDFSFDLRVYTASDEGVELARLACRFKMAAILLFFYDLSGETPEKTSQQILRNSLMSGKDIKRLSSYTPAQRSLIAFNWSGQVVCSMEKSCGLPGNIARSLAERLISSKQDLQTIHNTLQMPIPFPYFHLLNLMLVVNLGLWAYGMGVSHSIFAPICFFFAALIFCGMLEMAAQMTDPFGQDDVDFPINTWLGGTLADMGVLLEFQKEPGDWAEVAQRYPPFDQAMPIVDEMIEMEKAEVAGRHRSSWIASAVNFGQGDSHQYSLATPITADSVAQGGE